MRSHADAAVLQLRGVAKQYPGHTAVDDITFEVERGDFFALIGPSGCGKTTTLRMVAGFEEPTAGEIFLSGSRLNGLRPYERNVSTVFQSYALFPHLSARRNIEFGLRRKGMSDLDRRVRSILDLVRLSGKEDRKPSELSGGERQRVALARSLVIEPDVLLLDEPLSAPDPQLRKQVRSELKKPQRDSGVTFVIVTHDQEEALSLSDKIAVMNQGRIEQIGTPQEIYLKPKTRFVAGFAGPVNWIGNIGLRPEAVRIAPGEPPIGSRCVPATIANSVFLGNCFHVEARLSSGTPVTAEIPRDGSLFPNGQDVHVWWKSGDELRFE